MQEPEASVAFCGIDHMIKDQLFSFEFIKKSPFFGSLGGWRYRIGKKDGDELETCIYPEPYDFDHTPEEQKERHTFPFTPEGYALAAQHIQERIDQLSSDAWKN